MTLNSENPIDRDWMDLNVTVIEIYLLKWIVNVVFFEYNNSINNSCSSLIMLILHWSRCAILPSWVR